MPGQQAGVAPWRVLTILCLAVAVCFRPPCGLHHLVGAPAKDEGIGLREVLGRVTMQLLIRNHYTMIAASVQCDVDGIPKWPHRMSVPRSRLDWKFQR
ncbi:hypothetical protein [Variovorax sp. LjRoot178]|uniref:hypothetical protein n=1 Tax=Variovorax sp. LjRoot178 TaxID=3342277 RepID=UPI003ECC1AE1